MERYRLRGTSSSLYLRHRSRDIEIFNEIFGGTGGRQSYCAPAPLVGGLTSEETIDILDLGANIGLFALYAFGHWSVRSIVSYEPDPRNATVLRATIGANRLPWQVEEAAVSNRNGSLKFVSGLYSERHAAEDAENGIDVPTVDFFEVVRGARLVKMDIEGGEWKILTDPRLCQLEADAIVMEWHARGCPDSEPRLAAIRALAGAGYQLVEEHRGPSPTNGLIWLCR
jgi:FkbM family methyltransferase